MGGWDGVFGFGEGREGRGGGGMRLEVCDFVFVFHVGAIITAVADWLCCCRGTE